MERGWIRAHVVAALALLAACGSASDGTPLHDARGPRGDAETGLDALALRAVDVDPAVSGPAIAALREAGPPGLATLLEVHAESVRRLREVPLEASDEALAALRSDASLARVRAALDAVAAQRDAFASGLYWYTDLDAARAEAARSGRPILSLRLLGRLDEEASCANSRFFRWLLYPDASVQRVLAGYVLHWSSERPAPRITIDMGDGRTIERTITGNSVHYVLDASGRVIDAIAGLHAAPDFVARLDAARALAQRCGVREADRTCVAREHSARLASTRAAWLGLAAAGAPPWETLVRADVPAPAMPDAALAMPITVGKAAIEMPMLQLVAPQPIATASSPIPWDRIARSVAIGAIDEVVTTPSRALARLKTGHADDVGLASATYARVIEDTVRNRFTLDRRLSAWLAAVELPNELAPFNARVYDELFLTPARDPWLGLRSEDDWDVMETAD